MNKRSLSGGKSQEPAPKKQKTAIGPVFLLVLCFVFFTVFVKSIHGLQRLPVPAVLVC
jgi:hypothetical protein